MTASIIVDTPSTQGDEVKRPSREDQLASWVMGRVNRWREYRDNSFSERWGEYYRLWRGRWSAKDKNRSSERSRLIAPALSQAIEMTVAEMEEATFGREQWFDIRDDIKTQANEEADEQQLIRSRDKLLEDTYIHNVPDSIAAAYLNGALYGNGIAKIVVEKSDEKKILGRGEDGKPKFEEQTKIVCKLDPIPADEFIPDPAGTKIEEMLGCAHELLKPLSWVNRMQGKGTFRNVDLMPGDGDDGTMKDLRDDLEGHLSKENTVIITEYHGLVPLRLLPSKDGQARTELDEAIEQEEVESGDETLVEAIVTIANKGVLLRATKNPFWMQDRSIVSYQHEKVPGRFWGRGVAEKGFNPQKALDGELRSRMDALALISNPMMSADITRLPRGFDLKIRPGKLWLTNGAPKDVLQPVVFQGLDPSTFSQTGEMERMVQMGTGAMDSATPIRQNERNSTATGSSLQAAGFIKRSKRAMANVSRNFLQPIIRKILWRYMQFRPMEFPVDVDFRVMGTLGIVARELEQNQLTQMLGLVPEGSPPQLVLFKAIFDNSSSPYKAQINAAVDQMLAPPSEEEQAKQQFIEQIEMAGVQTELEGKRLENSKTQSEIVLNMAKARSQQITDAGTMSKIELEVQNLMKDLGELQALNRQTDAAMLNAHANFIKATTTKSGDSGNGNTN